MCRIPKLNFVYIKKIVFSQIDSLLIENVLDMYPILFSPQHGVGVVNIVFYI